MQIAGKIVGLRLCVLSNQVRCSSSLVLLEHLLKIQDATRTEKMSKKHQIDKFKKIWFLQVS